MPILKRLYKKFRGKPAPRYLDNSLSRLLCKPWRKWIAQSIAPSCPFNCVRIWLNRLCGFKIGKRCFIGMRCYLDDMCFDLLEIGNHVTISYGVYFACHGFRQGHYPIRILDGTYIGMRASIISKTSKANPEEGVTIGPRARIGACTLVNRDVPPDTTAVGVPCRFLSSNEKFHRHDAHPHRSRI